MQTKPCQNKSPDFLHARFILENDQKRAFAAKKSLFIKSEKYLKATDVMILKIQKYRLKSKIFAEIHTDSRTHE